MCVGLAKVAPRMGSYASARASRQVARIPAGSASGSAAQLIRRSETLVTYGLFICDKCPPRGETSAAWL